MQLSNKSQDIPGHPSYKRHLYSIFLLCFIFSIPCNTYARHFRDTLHFKKSIAEKHALVLSDSALNEIGIDSILNKIENVHNTLNRINHTTSVGFNTTDIEDNLPEIDSNIDIIDENLSLYTNVLDVKNLQMFDVLLAGLQNQLNENRTEIFKYEKELGDMSAEMGTFKHDTVLKSILADSAFSSLYLNEITDLKAKWKMAKKSISDNLTRINQLQSVVSNEYFTTIDLQNKSKDLLRKVRSKSMGKEFPFLWMARNEGSGIDSENRELAHKSYIGQRRILKYYFKRNSNDLLWLAFTGILLLLWVSRNFKKKAEYEDRDASKNSVFTFLTKVPILAVLVVVFNIAPFFDLHPPTAYVAIMEFLLVLSLTVMLWSVWPRNLYYYWLTISILYIITIFTGSILTPDLNFRLLLLALNVVSVIFGLLWFRALRKNTVTFSLMIRIVSVIFLLLNITAIFCNMFGRLSLAKIFSVTAIFGLTQIIGLTIFIQIIIEAFELQTIVNKLKGGITAKLNFVKIEALLRRALMFTSVVLWIIVFSISLNIYNLVSHITIRFLTTQRNIGNTNFQVGNILLFFAIIYISNILQQGVGSLYGRAESTWDPEVKKNGSRLAMTRLVLIVIGFLIAVAASGIPMDKITIVLGALGVGIGLGLQTIVNNLVSGVILIFEQPFRIGDFIEVGDKKGRVLDIGIRSSKIVMEEGAEIIMPNADLLSGRVINWTLRNDNVRLELPISLLPGHSFEEVQQVIAEELAKNTHVIMDIPPEILLLSVTDKAMSINVQVWINDVHKLQSIKSELLNVIYSGFSAKDIKVV